MGYRCLSRLGLAPFAVLLLAASPQAARAVPLRGSAALETTVTVIEPGVLWLVEGTGDGMATHVGRFHALFHYDVHVQTGEVTGWVRATAANGDQFGGTVTGQWSEGGARGTVIIDFGTGRFEDAFGSAEFTSAPDNVVFEGTISYNAGGGH